MPPPAPPVDPELVAALYAALHTGTPGDRTFYAEVCRGASTVLELGCGAGRLLPLLAGAERRVVGIDIDPALLSIARRTIDAHALGDRVRLREADMRELRLSERFDRVVLAFNGLWCLPGRATMRSALAVAAAHLNPGGHLALDVYAADAFVDEAAPEDLPEDALEPIATVQAAGTTWEVLERSRWDPNRARIVATYEHRGADGRQVIASIEHHYLLRDALLATLREAGLHRIDVRNGLAGNESILVQAWPDGAKVEGGGPDGS